MRLTAICVLLILFLTAPAAALDIPKLQARVTDLAGLLAAEQVSALDAKLKNLEETDSTQIAVLIIPSLEDEALEDYSERVATAWRLGQKGRDNGALLLLAMKERKVRIEVGYGLEPKLTDALSRSIIQNELAPHFREHDYYGGLDAAVSAMIQVVRGEYQATSGPARTSSRGRSSGRSFEWLIFLLFPLLWVLGSTGKWGGGILGAGAGIYLVYSLIGAALVGTLIGGLVGGLLGAFVGALVRAGSRSTGVRTGGLGGPFFGGGGSWGGGGGGGFSGGGFSGGGGSFGGGGSSGSW
jgi:uncharacterized protein